MYYMYITEFLEITHAFLQDLRKILKAKQEELSEACIRKELAEKKLSNATKDSEMTVEKLTVSKIF